MAAVDLLTIPMELLGEIGDEWLLGRLFSKLQEEIMKD